MTEYPQITVPQKMIDRLHKIKTKQALAQAEKKRKTIHKSPAVISGKRQEFNHYKGQSFNEFDVKKLSSHGWKHYKSKGDYFTIQSHGKNPSLQDTSKGVVNFAEMSLHNGIVNVLTSQGVTMPTKIQSLTIPKLLQGYNVICAAETGCGKTYAYLLPVLHNILREQSGTEEEVNPNSPRTVITVPTHELVSQLRTVLNPFEEELNLSVAAVDEKVRKKMEMKMDVLVTTPGSLYRMLKRRHINTGAISSFILDEADSLLDDSFSGIIKHILTFLQISSSHPTDHAKYVSDGVQVGLASATYPRGLDTLLEPVLSLENFEVVTTGHLHHLMPHVQQKFVRVGPDDKFMETVKLLKKVDGKPTLVFCNNSKTCYWLSKSLQSLDIKNHLLTGVDEYEARRRHLTSFFTGNCNVLICTDIASRGLDTHCVQQVINYDFPLFMSDYIHRAGRVGRVGSNHDCHVTSFVTNPWDVDLLWKIEIAARKEKELHNVNANIKRKITSVVGEKYGEDEVEVDDWNTETPQSHR